MSRSQIHEVVALSSTGVGINGAQVTVTRRDGTTPTIWQDATSSNVINQPLVSVNGLITGWLDDGSYKLIVNPPSGGPNFASQTVYVEVVNGADYVSFASTGGGTTINGIADVPGLQPALNLKQSTSEKGQPSGYAGLGTDGKVPGGQLPAATGGTTKPTITVVGGGTPQVGKTLRCSGNPGDYFQWTRDGSPISGATAQTYTVQAADNGHSLSCWWLPAGDPLTAIPGAPAAWANSKTITIDHTKVAGPLSNFTLAVDLTNDAQIAARAKADLSDLRFTDVNGGALSYEIETAGGSDVDIDSGWCWFNGPRAICNRGGATPTNKVFLGGVTSGGSVLVTELNVDTGATVRFALHSALNNPPDDHDAPGLFIRPDGKLQAFYSSHNSLDGKLYQRISTNTNDASAWAAEVVQTIAPGTQNVSYPKPFLLSGAGTPGTGRLFVFWRNNNDPHWFSFSDDLGVTGLVANAKPMFTSPDTFPYFTTPFSNDTDRIDFVTTNSHPRIVDTDLFHYYYSSVDDSFHFSDGTVIVSRTNLNATTGITPAMLRGTSSHVFVASGATEKRSWGSDLCYDATGKPVIAYTVWGDTTNFTDPKYRVARWTGTAWLSAIVTDAGPATDGFGPSATGTVGPWIGPAVQAGTIERQYTGLVSISRSDTSKIYVSKRVVSPISDQSSWELEQWTTPDAGVTWARSKRITPGSKQKNVRPLCPNYPGSLTTPPPEVFWMHGGYYHYRRLSTSLLCYPPVAAIPVKRGARVQVPTIDNITDAQVVMRYNNAGATDASGNPYTADTQMVVPLIGRNSSGNVWHHGDVQMSGWTALTLSVWATVTGADSINDVLFSNYVESGANIDPAAMLRLNNGAVSGFIITEPSAQVGGAFADMTGKNDGVLHHFALIYDQVALQLYVDGVKSTTTFAATAPLDISQGSTLNQLQLPTMLGAQPMTAPYARPIKGSILDVRVYNTAKSAAWVQTQAKARSATAPLYTIGAEQ